MTVEELQIAESLVGEQLATAVRVMDERHNCPDPLVSVLAISYLDLLNKRRELVYGKADRG